MKTYFHKIHYYEKMNLQDWFILPLLWTFSIFYGFIVAIKSYLYKIKVLKSIKLNAYVISVGNLTTGGTGKTPVTCEIANYVNEKLNKKVAIISRGYGGKLSNKKTNIISDGEKVFYNSTEAGDEPFWMAKNTQNTAVITGKDRIKSGQYAIENFKSEVLILDDGFQHLKLYRDLDIMLIDLFKVFGNGFLLPAGPLRESESQIERADKIIIVNKKPFDKTAVQKYQQLSEKLINKYQKKCFYCELTSGKIYDLKTKDVFSPQKAVAFAGIGQPEFFFNSLKQKNIELVSEIIFEDHYSYSKPDIENIIDTAIKHGADSIITTEKDAVKLNFLEELNTDIKICALKLDVNLDLSQLLETL